MDRRMLRYVAWPTLIGALFFVPGLGTASPESGELPQGHVKFTGVVTQKAGVLVVTTPNGATHQLNENMARRHGQEPFKAEDEVIVVLDENNYIIDMHLKGQGEQHQFVTGTLIYVGRTKKEIKLRTSDGEKVFPLAEEGQKTKGIEEGALVTVELNEAGTVIDLHRADTGGATR